VSRPRPGGTGRSLWVGRHRGLSGPGRHRQGHPAGRPGRHTEHPYRRVSRGHHHRQAEPDAPGGGRWPGHGGRRLRRHHVRGSSQRRRARRARHDRRRLLRRRLHLREVWPGGGQSDQEHVPGGRVRDQPVRDRAHAHRGQHGHRIHRRRHLHRRNRGHGERHADRPPQRRLQEQQRRDRAGLGGSGALGSGNWAHDNAEDGIFLQRSDGIEIRGNSAWDNGYAGIELDPSSDGNLVRFNRARGQTYDLANDGGVGNCFKHNRYSTSFGTIAC
jgi:parallel beta-helix repeat protein